MFFALVFVIWAWAVSLSSPEGFEQVKLVLQSFIAKFIAWGTITVLLYHMIGGIRHLIMDMGHWEELQSGKTSAVVTIVLWIVLAVLAGVLVMVLNQASLKRDGVQDYVSLRATAVILTLYTLFILGFFLVTPEVTYDVWKALFSSLLMKAFTLLTLVCIAVHTKIGLWQVLTDYVKNAALRGVLQFLLYTLAFGYVAVGLFVLWGV